MGRVRPVAGQLALDLERQFEERLADVIDLHAEVIKRLKRTIADQDSDIAQLEGELDDLKRRMEFEHGGID